MARLDAGNPRGPNDLSGTRHLNGRIAQAELVHRPGSGDMGSSPIAAALSLQQGVSHGEPAPAHCRLSRIESGRNRSDERMQGIGQPMRRHDRETARRDATGRCSAAAGPALGEHRGDAFAGRMDGRNSRDCTANDVLTETCCGGAESRSASDWIDPPAGWQSPPRAPLGTPEVPPFAQSRDSVRPAASSIGSGAVHPSFASAPGAGLPEFRALLFLVSWPLFVIAFTAAVVWIFL